MELRTASARGSDTNCRGSIVNQPLGRQARLCDLRRVGVAGTTHAALWVHKWIQKQWIVLDPYHIITTTIRVAQAPAPSQPSARHARPWHACAMHAQPSVEATQSSSPQSVAPTVSAGQPSSRLQPNQQVQEAYDLDTFLKERDACGVSLQLLSANLRFKGAPLGGAPPQTYLHMQLDTLSAL